MKITDFNRVVSQHEGRKEQISIAQIAEVCRVINYLTGGALYKLIRAQPPVQTQAVKHESASIHGHK